MDSDMSSIADQIAALKGEAVPPSLLNFVTVRCLIRGIRYHDGFAKELHNNPEQPMITRALNARAIMSNRVPLMSQEQFPYCFWHPDVPREETLKQLLAAYPDNALLRYQVGRACAAGGYFNLYTELCLLPDVAIAEEARDNQAGHAIYETIMKAPVRYNYMDDYNRCLRSEPLAGAYLNGDTCVRSILDQKLPIGPTPYSPVIHNRVFDITEDWSLDIGGVEPHARAIDPQTVGLLHSPLPADLPTVDKDLLILMAAWSGNIDRYVRLRRPSKIEGELPCIVRGIHHYPLFAKWWLTQSNTDPRIRQAVHARCIMNNDLSWLNDLLPDSDLPDGFIWYPQRADEATYRELLRQRPVMLHTIARACICADYEKLFTSLDIVPNMHLYWDAMKSRNKHYLKYLELKAVEHGIQLDLLPLPDEEDWAGPQPYAMLKQEIHSHNSGTQCMNLQREITLDHIGFRPEELATTASTVGQVLLHACIADPGIRPQPPYDSLNLKELYEAPPEDRELVGLWPPRGGYSSRARGRGRGHRRKDGL
ncbi:hypothetical protein BJX68DRAFT_273228 [Aspergillus pseudodeflectus]|uniref:Uncharacterized protein n=1 Tax=Aspergillus pseudodeflectus TaxID=176178 RepID=A0ABR4JAP3_9EURO